MTMIAPYVGQLHQHLALPRRPAERPVFGNQPLLEGQDGAGVPEHFHELGLWHLLHGLLQWRQWGGITL